jgi:hypothetical protein
MTTLRGLQLAAIYTGDTSWNKQPEQARKVIADKAVWAFHVILTSAAPTVPRTKSVACPLPARFSLTVARPWAERVRQLLRV